MSNSVPSVNDAVSETNATGEHIIALQNNEDVIHYIEEGYIKIDGIGELNSIDLENLLIKFRNEVIRITKDNTYNDSSFYINVVPPSVIKQKVDGNVIITPNLKKRVYGIAWILVKENVPGHRLYNILIGKNPDGTAITGTQKLVAVIGNIQMNVSQTTSNWNRIQQEYGDRTTSEDYITYKRSFEDYQLADMLYRCYNASDKSLNADKLSSFVDKYINVLLDRRDIDKDDEELYAEEEKYLDMLEDIEKYLSDEIEDFDLEGTLNIFKKHLAHGSELINLCHLIIEPAHVSDSKPGDSPNHLITLDLSLAL